MSKSKMRIGSILLVVAMLMTLLPAGVFAAEGDSIIEVTGTCLLYTSHCHSRQNRQYSCKTRVIYS